MARSNTVKRRFNQDGESFDVFDCGEGHEFSRRTIQGVKPFYCPDHAPIAPRARTARVAPVVNAPAISNPVPGVSRHYRFSLIRAILGADVHVFLVGPAGSGKTTVARQVADDMGLDCYAESGHELMTAYDLLGFATADGGFKVTKLYKAVEFGGVFLMDEMDAMNAAALVAVNNIAALKAGDKVWFDDREIVVHPDFHLIGGGNTWGRGANGAYVTRQVIDAATLDRFACIEFGYDAHLEFLSVGVSVPADVPAPPRYKRGGPFYDGEVTSWVREVQRYRAAFQSSGIEDAMVTPRASIMGSKMGGAGIHMDYIVASLIRKGLSDDEWRTVKAHMPSVPVNV